MKRCLTPAQSELLKATFLDETHFDTLITSDADGYDLSGKLLFRFRRGAVPFDLLKTGAENLRDAVQMTEMRGIASGGGFHKTKADGTISKNKLGEKVASGIAGFMDSAAMTRYCRKTAFVRNYFDQYTAAVPFIEHVDRLYKELCPRHYAKQIAIATGTNRNYRIAETSFTTVTVNENFRTAAHQDAGDLPDGFGNLCVYREGHYDGAYLVLPEYRVAVDLQNTDLLFMDVHKWHGNTEFKNTSEDYLRIAFVMYYREYMYKCASPKAELKRVQMDSGGFLKL